MASPNFPPDLAIRPLQAAVFGAEDEWAQQQGIERHGIAGRVWEASLLLNRYLQRPSTASEGFDPPCPLFTGRSDGEDDLRPGRTVLELGAGIGHASCELGALLSPADLILMTDLPEVVPLMEDRRARFLARRPGASARAEVWVRTLAWGEDDEREIADELLSRRERSGNDSPAVPLVDLVIASDLVYFPSLS